jgi:uncharacterized protein YjiK
MSRFVSAGRYLAFGIATALVVVMCSPSAGVSAAATASVVISEVHPSGSGNGTYAADWFEVTNTGASAVDITGWKMDDNSNSFASAVPLSGVTSISPGQAVVFIDSTVPVNINAFETAWFGASVPAGFTFGTYGGAGVGLSTGGDAVNLFDASGNRITGISFGAATANATFDNTAALSSQTLPLPVVSALSAAGFNGAFLSFDGKETGSPGTRLNASPLSDVDLSLYVRIGRYELPEPTRTTPPANSLLAQEASAVTYDWDTDTLFVVGDGGTSVVQVSKTGQLIDSMTLAPGSSPQGTDFYDPEGLTYVGGGKFVMSEERDRQVVLFTYVPGATLHRADTQTVKLGTFVDNVGNEGISFDPLTTAETRGFIVVKETQPEGIFQTNIDFAAGTATNGGPATVNPADLFSPALANLADFADVFALSNLPTLSGPDSSRLLVLSQESGKVVNISRSGAISSSLTIHADAGDLLSIPDMQHEGITMDFNGILYLVSENGGGDINHPQLWVYARSSAANQPPTAVGLNNQVNSIAENTSTAVRIKVADVVITDDGLGANNLTVTGPDAAFFEVDSTGLFIKAGTILDFETKTNYSVTVNVDDPTVGVTPDATAAYSLTVTDEVNETPPAPPSLIISEVTPWASGNAPYAADWFEVTNTGTSPVNISGWKMDDNSNAFGNAVALTGISNIAPGESVIFVETSTLATTKAAFLSSWFGANPPSDLQVGGYSGSGVGLSTGGDAVNLFDASGNRVTGVSFDASTTGFTFDNMAGIGGTVLPLPTISTLSVAGVNGAFLSSDGHGTGSPGTTTAPVSVIISEVSPWSSGNSPYGADWFEVTNTGATEVNLTGWKMDDNSNSFADAVALRGVPTLPPGKSAVFIEGLAGGSTDAALIAAFSTAWFGSATPPSGFLIGAYGGSGVGLSTGGDAINLFDAFGRRVAGVVFGSSTTGFTFDNAAGLGSPTLPLPAISTLSAMGVNGAFLASNAQEVGSPGLSFVNRPPVADAGPDQTSVEATGPGGALVTLNGSGSADPDGNALAYTWTEGGAPVATGVGPVVALALGTHTLTLTVDDGKATASDAVLITVHDSTPPTIRSVEPSQTELWPPNNKTTPISVAVKATDVVAPSPVCAIAVVSSNEPGNGQWEVTGPFTLNLTASRNGNGNGRVYTIAVQCSDAAGNSSSQSTTVIVPHDKRHSEDGPKPADRVFSSDSATRPSAASRTLPSALPRALRTESEWPSRLPDD